VCQCDERLATHRRHQQRKTHPGISLPAAATHLLAAGRLFPQPDFERRIKQTPRPMDNR